ncbi:phage tail protein [Paraburkholderia sp. Tr-20389]|uniref:phage tail protein n=1 Tax=Paraburkholderia sp. Tr-20389 TaxID=2703903 RepID=UPI001981BFF9|nr:phage tail protein [Paraburkholderia sp. Tr-20389]MBN3753668.1 phage tail protein [Paraburkholderia sp. Tr-20389]
MPTKGFSVNINRYDPYKSFRFLVFFGTGTDPILGVNKVTGLKRSSDVIDYKEGGDPIIRKGLGRTKYESITLERGITQGMDFIHWADMSQQIIKGQAQTSLANLRQDIHIQLLNEAGQPVIAYIVHRCWVSEYQVHDFDANGSAIALEHVKLENEGWERDSSVFEIPEI